MVDGIGMFVGAVEFCGTVRDACVRMRGGTRVSIRGYVTEVLTFGFLKFLYCVYQERDW